MNSVMTRMGLAILWVISLALVATACGGTIDDDLGNHYRAAETRSDDDTQQGDDDSGDECIPGDSGWVFDHAVCLCGDLDTVGNGLTTKVRGTSGSWLGGQSLAHVGVNGQVDTMGNFIIGGLLDIGSTLTTRANLIVDGDLFAGGDANLLGNTILGDNAFFGAKLSGRGNMHVPGSIHVAGSMSYVGNMICDDVLTGMAFVAHSPCPCEPADLLDVAGMVAAQRGAEAIVLPTEFGNHSITLDSGNYYTDQPGLLAGNTIIQINGLVRIFIEADIETIGNSIFKLGPDGDLEIYVAGSVHTMGNFLLGTPFSFLADARPIRLYIGGSGTVDLELEGNTILNAAVYAPQADLSFRGNLIVSGALFLNSLKGWGNVQVSYDSSLAGSGDCEPGDDGDDGQEPGDDGDDGQEPGDDGDDGEEPSCDPSDDTCHPDG